MTDQIKKRLKILGGYNSVYHWKEGNPEKTDRTLKLNALLDYPLAMVMLCLVLFISASASLQIETAFNLWDNAAMLVLMTISLTFRAPFATIELVFKKHADSIKNTEINFDEKLNNELEYLVSKFNHRKRFLYLFGIPAFLILLAALLQIFDLNPYWDKFPLIVFVLCIYITGRINYDFLRIKKNFKKVNAFIEVQ